MELKNPNRIFHEEKKYVYSCQYHVIFCPKYRRSVLINGIEKRLKELIHEKQKEYNYEVIDIEVMPNHVHLLLDINPKMGIWSIISKIKGYTSNTLRKEFPVLRSRLPTLWSGSKFIGTVGSISLDVIKKYIEEQKNK
ncbi:MAG: IS200/IS605 family transposase [Synergistaceae bacterium]